MSLETGLKAALVADSAVNAIVSGRVFSEIIPQGQDLPALVFERVTTQQEQQLDGPQPLSQATMRIHCWSTTAAGMTTLADAVRALLNVGEKLTLGSFVTQQVYLDDQFPQSVFEGDQRDYRIIQQYVILYEET